MRWPILLALAATLGCGHSTTTAPPVVVAPPPPEAADATLAALLAEEGYAGVIAAADEDGPLRCSDVALCDVRERPASTFKIANAIVALETGVAPDAELVIPWDRSPQPVAEWERDHTLRSAIAVSAVPYFQALARRIGLAQMRTWIGILEYGNGEIGAVVDRFWLDGPLEISPREQVGFLQRLATGRLPITAGTQAVMLDVLTLDASDGILRGKTGWGRTDEPQEFGWFVGWLEKDGSRRYVAVLLRRGEHPVEAFQAARRRIAERVLRRP